MGEKEENNERATYCRKIEHLKKQQQQTLWPLFMDGVQLPEG